MNNNRPTGFVVYTISKDDKRFINNPNIKRSIMQLHIVEVENLVPLSDSSELLLKEFTEQLFKHISALIILSANDNSFDWFRPMMDIVTKKLDPKSRKLWKIVAAEVNHKHLGLWTLMEFLMVRCRYFEKNDPKSVEHKDTSADYHICSRQYFYYPLSRFDMNFRKIAGFNLCKKCIKRGHVHGICIETLYCDKCKLYSTMCQELCEPSHLVIDLINCYESSTNFHNA